VEAGFDARRARRALRACESDPGEALDWLLAQRDAARRAAARRRDARAREARRRGLGRTAAGRPVDPDALDRLVEFGFPRAAAAAALRAADNDLPAALDALGSAGPAGSGPGGAGGKVRAALRAAGIPEGLCEVVAPGGAGEEGDADAALALALEMMADPRWAAAEAAAASTAAAGGGGGLASPRSSPPAGSAGTPSPAPSASSSSSSSPSSSSSRPGGSSGGGDGGDDSDDEPTREEAEFLGGLEAEEAEGLEGDLDEEERLAAHLAAILEGPARPG
jgi:hypothetical protein